MKVHRHHFERWGGFEGDVVVRIVREDRLAQAVSWARARQTNRWADFQTEQFRPRYSRRLIQRCLDSIEADEGAWARQFPQALVLTYEGLAADLNGTVDRVLERLGEHRVGTVEAALSVQADEVNRAWAERFRAGG
jgi:LPS sulfotransferase NodH